MPSLAPQGNFEPSTETKQLWRFTRKTPATFAGVTLPGLFQTSRQVSDTALFFTALLLEIWGLSNFLIVGGANPFYVVVLFLVDIVLAVLRHLPEGAICELRNRLICEDDADVQARLVSRLQRHRLMAQGVSVLICLVAVFKIISFIGLQGGGFTGLALGILVSYIVTAIIHISVTGYFLFSVFTELSCWLDRRGYLDATTADTDGIARNQINDWCRHHFAAPPILENATADRHRLFGETEPGVAEDTRHYCLETWGVLTDAQLQTLVVRQSDHNAKAIVAREGVRHQVENILQTGRIASDISPSVARLDEKQPRWSKAAR